ncbi:MAG TPA: 50S ribosomal protein L3 [Longimicrobium sp.]|jgi:large subunit ribosomal protein L3|nr:50S ribosomal protein L3 [Longimicrobium sp.]
MSGIIGRKLGMTQIFDESGAVVPVTVIEAGPCPVVQVRTEDRDGYAAVQLGFGAQKDSRATRAEKGHATKAGLETAPRVLKEFRFDDAPAVGENVTVDGFQSGIRVKVTGVTKGRGFQGVMKRHGFGGGRASHGATRVHRAPGSIGAGTNPSRVIKGKKMPGHMGNAQQTVRNLLVAKVDAERNLLYVRGAVPGPVNGVVFVTKQ